MAAFTLTAPYRVVTAATHGASICEQDGAFHAVRIESTTEVGPIPFVAVGPYDTADDALTHAAELPPPAPHAPPMLAPETPVP